MRNGLLAENILVWKRVEVDRVRAQDQEITADMVHCLGIIMKCFFEKED